MAGPQPFLPGALSGSLDAPHPVCRSREAGPVIERAFPTITAANLSASREISATLGFEQTYEFPTEGDR